MHNMYGSCGRSSSLISDRKLITLLFLHFPIRLRQPIALKYALFIQEGESRVFQVVSYIYSSSSLRILS